jgi:hypothetical protein
MALDLTKIDPTGSGSKGAIKIITYGPVSDTLATIEGANYFQSLASLLKTGDIMYVDASNGQAQYRLTVSGTTVTLVGLLESESFTQELQIDDISLTMGAAFRIPFAGTVTGVASLLANIRGSGASTTLQAFYNGTAIPTASTIHTTADAAYAQSVVSNLSLAVTAGGVLSVVSDGGATGGINGGQVPATFSFTIRRS